MLVQDVLGFLARACQKDRGGFAKLSELVGKLDIHDPESIVIDVYPEDDYMGPGWSKLWKRMLKEGKRIPPSKEDE